jgi:hypothetical protein
MSYVTRYCAFVDILGFRGLIAELNSGRTTYEAIRSALQKIHKPLPDELGLFEGSDFRAQSISDAVCVSSAENDMGLLHMLYSLTSLSFELLCLGYFVRGAIVLGKLYHDDEMVFGDALVRAYELETNVARFPRIIIPREIVGRAMNLSKERQQLAADFISQGSDGPFYLHVLAGMERKVDAAKAADMIQRRFNESVDNPRHFEKVKWFAEYWNAVVSGRGGLSRLKMIHGVGLSEIH